MLESNYQVLSDGYTPGLPNNLENQNFIDSLKPIVCPGEPITLGCQGDATYCYLWDGGAEVVPQQGGQATIYPTATGTGRYIRTTLDGEGNLIGSTVFFVRTYPTFDGSITEEQLTPADCPAEATFRFTVSPTAPSETYDYLWSTGEKTVSIEALGDQSYTVTITGSNGCQVVETVEPEGDPTMLGQVSIAASTPMLCGDNPVQLTTSFSNYSGNGNRTYLWSNGSTTATTQVTVAGEYRVTVTTSAGCVFTDEIEIDPGFTMHVIADADQACAENPVHLQTVLTGQTTLGLYYEWSTGTNTSDIYVT
ncbi:MAG: hypothetical protein AAF597_14700, partial [Bacteroidota bacterium]